MSTTAHTADMGRTTIQVSDELADELHGRKGRGDSYEDVIWRLIEKVEDGGRSDDEAESGVSDDAVGTRGLQESAREGVRDDTEVHVESDETDSRRALRGVEFPSTVDREEAIEAILAARNYLREHETASMRDIVMDVMPEHSLGYDVPELEEGDRYKGSWWRNVVKDGLEALPDVEYRDTYNDYQYTGDE